MGRFDLSPERVAAMRAAYEEGQGHRAVAALGGMSPTSLRRYAAQWGWRLRPPSTGTASQRPVPPPPFRPAPDGAPLRVRLERLVAHRIEALELEAGSGRAVDPDANAKAIAANTRTLALLRRLPPEPKEEMASDDEPPRSLADLRDELRRHLERIAEEERSGPFPPGRFPPGPDPDGDGDAARPLADHVPDGAAAA